MGERDNVRIVLSGGRFEKKQPLKKILCSIILLERSRYSDIGTFGRQKKNWKCP